MSSMQIPGFTILSTIGAGGMGIVYLAEDTKLGRKVAVKVLSDVLSENPSIRKRFFNEAKLMGGMSHPNIVVLYDFIEFDRRLALIMEFVDGKGLDKTIGEEVGPIPFEHALPLFRQILDAAGYAHECGVIHRDLKPSNILVSNRKVAKLTDFGIAKIAGDEGMTRTGTKLGTLCYMSPEQVQGADADHRTDIYALGVTLYEMLSGRMPLNEHTTSDLHLMNAIVKEGFPDPREYYPHIPAWLVKTVFRAIHREADKRFSSCGEFLDTLEKGAAKAAKQETPEFRRANAKNEVAKEKAARDEALGEQAVREKRARELAAEEKASKKRAEQDRKAKEKAARELAAEEKTAREREEKERAKREREAARTSQRQSPAISSPVKKKPAMKTALFLTAGFVAVLAVVILPRILNLPDNPITEDRELHRGAVETALVVTPRLVIQDSIPIGPYFQNIDQVVCLSNGGMAIWDIGRQEINIFNSHGGWEDAMPIGWDPMFCPPQPLAALSKGGFAFSGGEDRLISLFDSSLDAIGAVDMNGHSAPLCLVGSDQGVLSGCEFLYADGLIGYQIINWIISTDEESETHYSPLALPIHSFRTPFNEEVWSIVGRIPLITLGRDGIVYTSLPMPGNQTLFGYDAQSGECLLDMTFTGREYQKSVQDIQQERDLLTRITGEERTDYFPDSLMPVISSLGVDSLGRIWLQQGNPDSLVFDIYSPEGELLMTLFPELPAGTDWIVSVQPFGIIAYTKYIEDVQRVYMLRLVEDTLL